MKWNTFDFTKASLMNDHEASIKEEIENENTECQSTRVSDWRQMESVEIRKVRERGDD